MKKFLLLLLIAGYYSHAQTVATGAADALNAVLGQLEKPRVPHGLLLDYALEFTEVPAYNGTLSDQNYLHIRPYKAIYNTLLMARVQNTVPGLYAPAEFNNRWNTRIAQQKTAETPAIVLSGLYYTYSRLKANALATNKIQVVNNQYLDKYNSGVWQNPYETLSTFAVSAPVSTVRGAAVSIQLPAELWYTNQAAQVQSLAVDMGDGQGYQPLPIGGTASAVYAQESVYTWTFRLSLSSGAQLYSRSKIQVSVPVPENIQARNPFCGIEELSISATRLYLGDGATADLQIAYGSDDCQMRKPLIVAEGFDTGLFGEPSRLGDTDYSSFDRIIFLSDSNELRDLLRNNSPNDYDIVYVNWANGTDYLQRNAYALEEVIHWVNQRKALAGSVEPNVVWGQSMGGVIARYALRDMENRGEVHDTWLYISQDAPHQGANVPIGFQYAVRHLIDQFIDTPLGDFSIPVMDNDLELGNVQTLLNAPATRQLLHYYISSNFGMDNSAHTAWQAELQALGYPQQTRNIALSNGSHCAVGQEIAPGATLLSLQGEGSTGGLTDLILTAARILLPGFNIGLFVSLADLLNEPALLLGILPGNSKIEFDFRARALSANGPANVYQGEISFTKTLLWVAPISLTLTDRSYNSPAGNLAYDSYPGGFYATPVGTLEGAGEDIWLELFAEYGFELSVAPGFNFIPVPSALDLGLGAVPLTHADYLTSYTAQTPPVPPKVIPFANFTTSYLTGSGVETDNEQHLSLNWRTGDWLADELNNAPVAFNCAFVCNNVISGPGLLCGAGNYSVFVFGDATVNWSVSDPNAVTLATAAGSATLTAVNGYRKAIVLTASISSDDCDRVLEVTKNIWVGAPATPPALSGPTTVVTGALVNYQGSTAPGATSYQWFLPGAYQTVASYDYLGNQWQKLTTATTQAVQVFTGWGKYNGSVQVAGVNACGCGGARSLYVTHPSPAGGGGSGLQPAPGGGIPKFSEPGGGVKSQIDAPATDSLAVAGFELQQNSPNPFHQTTIIVAQLPESVQQATIVVYSTQGVALASYPLNERGKVSVEISGGRFPAGMYLYALLADGQVIDTKKMLLTN